MLLSTKMLWKDSYIKPFLTWAILAIISFFLFPKLSLHGLKKSRKFVKDLFPILVPNSLFNSEEQYNNFIESITD